AFVKVGMQIPERSMVMGAPARVLRELSDQEIARKRRGTHYYQQLTRRCHQTLQEVEPLPQVEADRRRITLDLIDPQR
ncbi:MAG: phenylacetic acid degradation protein PaaY, partial [Burkholderiaceae bacterium]